MKTSTKVQILLFFAILLAGFAWKFHLLPTGLYGIFPVGIKSIKANCYYRSLQGSCAIFQCDRDVLSTRFSYLNLPPNRQNKYLLKGTVYFRNKKEICAGLNAQPDTYFEVEDMVELQTTQTTGQ